MCKYKYKQTKDICEQTHIMNEFFTTTVYNISKFAFKFITVHAHFMALKLWLRLHGLENELNLQSPMENQNI